MNKELVRCWKKDIWIDFTEEIIYLTYPEGHMGHNLISCLNCAQLYSVCVAKEMYIGPPLAEKIKELSCIKCHKPLFETYSDYPDRFLSVSGKIKSFKRPIEIPPDEESLVEEFYSIY